MKPFNFPDLAPLTPEIMLACFGMAALMIGAFAKQGSYRLVTRLCILALIAVATVVFGASGATSTTFEGMFVTDGFAAFMKMLVLGGSIAALLMATKYMEREKINRFEYPVLILFSTLGMMLMISANDLISLYMALELQSLPLYVLAAFNRDNLRSSEAGLKYFVLGALSSGLLLYGMSLIYGFTGATGFSAIASSFGLGAGVPLGVVTGMVFMIAGLAFKISAVPFHMWAPDVYEGAPTPVTAFFAIVPKVAAIALFVRVFAGAFGDLSAVWQQVIIVISAASMALGAVAAVVQANIKRLLAYSSIGHMGYALVGLAAVSAAGIQAIILYMALYAVTSIGVFCVVLMMKKDGKMVENISDLAGLAKGQPLIALAMAILMFSMAGIPPLAGFFGKLLIFQAAVNAGLYPLAVFGVLTSVVAAYYYLRVIKVMYFDEPAAALDRPDDAVLKALLLVSTLAIVVFIVVPVPLMTAAQAAASLAR